MPPYPKSVSFATATLLYLTVPFALSPYLSLPTLAQTTQDHKAAAIF